MKKKNDKKTKGFWGTMWAALKEAKKCYKIQMAEAAERKRLLNNTSDWTMLEAFIQKINNNPKLKIRVELKDGTVLILNTYEEKEIKDYQLLDL